MSATQSAGARVVHLCGQQQPDAVRGDQAVRRGDFLYGSGESRAGSAVRSFRFLENGAWQRVERREAGLRQAQGNPEVRVGIAVDSQDRLSVPCKEPGQRGSECGFPRTALAGNGEFHRGWPPSTERKTTPLYRIIAEAGPLSKRGSDPAHFQRNISLIWRPRRISGGHAAQ